MKSVLCRRYGGPEVLEIREVPRPVPRVGEVLVRVRAATVTSGDSRVRGARIPFGFRTLGRVALGFRGPRAGVLGMELCGDVVEVGAGVKSFRVGDAVIGFRGVKMGAHAEYVCMAEGGVLVRKPVGMTYEEGASIAFGGLTALYFVRDKAALRNRTPIRSRQHCNNCWSKPSRLARSRLLPSAAFAKTPRSLRSRSVSHSERRVKASIHRRRILSRMTSAQACSSTNPA